MYMERFEKRNFSDKYVLSRYYNISTINPCVIHGYWRDIYYNTTDCCFAVQEDEVKSLNFYNTYELDKLLKNSKLAIEIAGRTLQAGDLVVGYFKYGKSNKLCMGMYIGKKQVYTIDGEVNCNEVFLIEPNFMLYDEVELLKRLQMLYTVSSVATVSQSNMMTPGDVVCTSSKSLYLYLGQHNIENKCSYVYLNFSVKSLKQSKFLEFLKGSTKANIAIGLEDYSLAKFNISDLKLRGILLGIVGACSGKFLVTNKLKSFSTLVFHLDIVEKERCDLKFRKTKEGYMIV